MKKAVFAQGAPAAIGPYSHGVAIGDLFFTSGQIALVPETGKLVDGGIQEQTEQDVYKRQDRSRPMSTG